MARTYEELADFCAEVENAYYWKNLEVGKVKEANESFFIDNERLRMEIADLEITITLLHCENADLMNDLAMDSA